MDATNINACIKAIENVFTMMLQTEVVVQAPLIKTSHEPKYDVSAIIGLSGDMVGVIVLSFPVEVAERVATTFTGMPMKVEMDDFSDAIGELANMISGNAKASFEGKSVQITCPTVIVGKGHQVFRQRDLPTIELPCTCPCGDFLLEISVKDVSPAAASPAQHAVQAS